MFQLVTTVGRCTKDSRVLAELAQIFLRAVVASNRVLIRERKARGRPIPALYSARIRYKREPWDNVEEFADILTVLRRGWGDCDDLGAWRVAELQEAGEEGADIRVYWREKIPGRPRTMHVQVRRADGTIEDPSRYLGL